MKDLWDLNDLTMQNVKSQPWVLDQVVRVPPDEDIVRPKRPLQP